MWITHLGCEEIVRDAWSNLVPGSPSFTLVQKIKIVRDDLKRWNKDTFGNFKARKRSLEHSLKKAKQNLESSHACRKEREIRKELEQLANQEQIFWIHKSRNNWIFHENRNTIFNYTVTARKKIKGRINGIFNSQGQWIDQHEKISSTFSSHFKELFVDP